MEVITLVFNTGYCGDGNGVKLDLTTMQQFNQERYLLEDKKISLTTDCEFRTLFYSKVQNILLNDKLTHELMNTKPGTKVEEYILLEHKDFSGKVEKYELRLIADLSLVNKDNPNEKKQLDHLFAITLLSVVIYKLPA